MKANERRNLNYFAFARENGNERAANEMNKTVYIVRWEIKVEAIGWFTAHFPFVQCLLIIIGGG